MALADILTMNSDEVILGNGETDSSTEKKDMSIKELLRLLTVQHTKFLNDIKTTISGTDMVEQVSAKFGSSESQETVQRKMVECANVTKYYKVEVHCTEVQGGIIFFTSWQDYFQPPKLRPR